GRERDAVAVFTEDSVLAGRYGEHPVSHLDLLPLLGVTDGLRGAGEALKQGDLQRVARREVAAGELGETREAPIA
ncbi:MAG TPA: hypothetical protein VFC23_03075, partial [Thermoanaerobaculia bacterium]|nr:hypothetical protein [Thermoanaerobaculia bacterium]